MNLIDHLPRNSYYQEALTSDPDWAKAIARAKVDRAGGKFYPPMSTWSPEISALGDVWDKLEEIRHTLVAVNAKHPPANKPARYPRPVTAIQAAENELRLERHKKLADRLLGDRRRKNS